MDDALEVVRRFNDAWNDHDLDAAVALTSDDCVFDSTDPAPDGELVAGHAALRRAWAPIFANPASHFDQEAMFTCGDRVVQLWRFSWGDGHVRGVDVIRVQDGLVVEKLSYVKG